MPQNDPYYKRLVLGFISNSISPEQVKELYEFINREPEKYARLMDEPEVLFQIKQQLEATRLEISPDVDERLQEQLKKAVEQARATTPRKRPLVFQLTTRWRWIAALFIAALGTIAILNVDNKRSPDLAVANGNKQLKADILPGKTGAILTLANGSKVLLDSLGNGVVTTQGKTTILIQNGHLVYNASAKQNEILYNTMTTPKGRQYQLVLPDGSQVWLNAASSITYPTMFSGNNRTVTIEGEAYFEVTEDKTKPFHVKVKDMDVEVLGTHFNINSYEDEAELKTTLLKGGVKVSRNGQASVLKPGQQAIVDTRQVKVINDADIEEVMAWKYGLFRFHDMDINSIMRQVSRWYNVDVEYKGPTPPYPFKADIERDVPVSELLSLLELTNLIHFEIEGRKITVMR